MVVKNIKLKRTRTSTMYSRHTARRCIVLATLLVAVMVYSSVNAARISKRGPSSLGTEDPLVGYHLQFALSATESARLAKMEVQLSVSKHQKKDHETKKKLEELTLLRDLAQAQVVGRIIAYSESETTVKYFDALRFSDLDMRAMPMTTYTFQRRLDDECFLMAGDFWSVVFDELRFVSASRLSLVNRE